MGTRTFWRKDLLALDLPPHSPDDVQYRYDVHLDEHVRTLKYTQLRRCVFEVPDGRTYAVEYQAPIDTGDFEVGCGPVENHGWARTVDAVEVELRPVAVMQWKPVAGEAKLPHGDERTAADNLADIYGESGHRDSDCRRYAAQTLALHVRELAAFLQERHPDAARDLLGHASDLDEQAQ
ncbi:hypothetical protein ABZ499_33070 [Streptomyces sp. NPDC019990]|uniref:hypothetical protein n=1 Tax=Streptomyces sp. NPDC019990 TaxID=3154693 RepID=UPI0033F21B30